MIESKIRLGILGVAGRMGREILTQAVEDCDFQIVAAVENEGSKLLGIDCGEIIGAGELGVKISEKVDESYGRPDVIIDFSSPESSLSNLEFCSRRVVPCVIGTTGLKDCTRQLKEFGKKIPILFSPNMSVGVNATYKLVEELTKLVGSEADIEIIEAHHRDKLDAPSGTALRLGEIIAGKLGRRLEDCAVYGRKGNIGRRPKETIGFETIRAGDIVGDHTVIFAMMGERIEISHKASSRAAFASGALRAASWLIGKEAGLYDMKDVLK